MASASILQPFTIPSLVPANVRVRVWYEGSTDPFLELGPEEPYDGWVGAFARCRTKVYYRHPGPVLPGAYTMGLSEWSTLSYEYNTHDDEFHDLLGVGQRTRGSVNEVTFTTRRGPQLIYVIPEVWVGVFNTGGPPGGFAAAGFQDGVSNAVPVLSRGSYLKVRSILIEWCPMANIDPVLET